MTRNNTVDRRLAYIALISSLVFGIAGQLMMKYAAVSGVSPGVAGANLMLIGSALLVYGLGVICWIIALRGVRLSVAYPLSSLNYVGIFMGSYYLFDEVITPQRLLGVALIFVGVLLIVLRARDATSSSL